MTPHEKELLVALQNAGADASVTDILRRNRLSTAAETRKQLSSRLCKLRDKGLAVSYQQDGVNYWSPTEAGWKALGRDIPAPEPAPESPSIQPIEPDILPDISASMLTEEDRVAGIRSGQIPTYPLSAVQEPPRFEYVPDSADDIDPALVQESMRIRPIPPFTGLPGALFVLETLAVAYCPGMPAYQTEIERIADYLREAAA